MSSPHRPGLGPHLAASGAAHPHTTAAEALVARLGALAGAPARIVWDPGLRRGHGLNGYTSPKRPAELHVDPDLGEELLLETAAHEWIHGLEMRGLVPLVPILIDGGRCSVLAIRAGSAIASQAGVATSSDVLLEQAIAAAIFEHTGSVPVRFAGTRRSSR